MAARFPGHNEYSVWPQERAVIDRPTLMVFMFAAFEEVLDLLFFL
jgi:hypothetical protein